MPKILQISDLHVQRDSADRLMGVDTEACFRKVLELAYRQHRGFDLILVTGDLAQDPCSATYHRILKCLQAYETETLCLPGNHDDYALMQGVLNQGKVSCRKRIRLQAWQIICLNSQKTGTPDGLLAEEEMTFLGNCLKEEPDLPTLIAMHHHCIPTGCAWLDCMQIENSSDFLDLLRPYHQVKAVTFGHVHKAIATEHRGLRIFSAPATCFQFEMHSQEFSVADTPAGYRVFDLLDGGEFNTACYRLAEPPPGLNHDAHGY